MDFSFRDLAHLIAAYWDWLLDLPIWLSIPIGLAIAWLCLAVVFCGGLGACLLVESLSREKPDQPEKAQGEAKVSQISDEELASVDTSIRPYVITQNPAKENAAFEG